MRYVLIAMMIGAAMPPFAQDDDLRAIRRDLDAIRGELQAEPPVASLLDSCGRTQFAAQHLAQCQALLSPQPGLTLPEPSPALLEQAKKEHRFVPM